MSPLHLDPRMPPADTCVLRPLLERRAAETPDRIYAWFEAGEPWTYREARRQAARTANALRALGVRRGDKVVSWLPNGPDAIRLWFGLNYLGAVYVPINLAYRGGLLQHVIENSDARLIVAHAQLLPRLAQVPLGRLTHAVALAGDPPPTAGLVLPGLVVHDAAALDHADEQPPPLDAEIAPWDLQSVIYTSGTTGTSKGVLSSYMHLYSMSSAARFFGAEDRFMVDLPLFHVGGTYPTYSMMIRGGSIAVVERFETAAFWRRVRASGATTSIILGSMAGFLLGRPPRDDDRDHALRTVTMVPLSDIAAEFARRFGCEIHTHFNMTEVSMPILSEPNPRAIGSAGRPRPGAQARVVDDNDCEVPPGVVGELVVRTDCPWAMNHGYYKEPAATAAAWRNGWFHTGDLFRIDEAGNFYFVDRLKDAIRRRGENISSFEVESEVYAHPAVKEAAAVAVPSEHGEDEVLIAVVARDGAEIDPEELVQFLIPRLPHYMVPRYVWRLPELPKTPTQKVQKHLIRAAAATATPPPWDREAAGVVVRRERLAGM
jgi:carnitine-CoA ligase